MKISTLMGNCLYRLFLWSQVKRGEYLTDKLSRNGSKGIVSGRTAMGYVDNIYIGENSYINGGEVVASSGSQIHIGDNCMISYNVHIRTDMHRHNIYSSIPMCQQGVDESDIVIGDNVWIGYGAQIMSGVTIGSNVIIGAGAVVTRDIPSFSIWGGVPAREITKQRMRCE